MQYSYRTEQILWNIPYKTEQILWNIPYKTEHVLWNTPIGQQILWNIPVEQSTYYGIFLLGDSGGVVNSLDFCPASLKSLGCF